MRWMVAAVGALLIGVALLVWWTAEQALPPAPKVTWSAGGAISECLGDRSCDPPVIPGETVAVIAILAGAGAVLIVAVAVEVALRRRAG